MTQTAEQIELPAIAFAVRVLVDSLSAMAEETVMTQSKKIA